MRLPGIVTAALRQHLERSRTRRPMTLDVYAHVRPDVADDAAQLLDRFHRNIAPSESVVARPGGGKKAAPEERPANLVEACRESAKVQRDDHQ
jgi:hypothetical protein